MKFLSLEPFIPSGKDFAKARAFFIELGFSVSWDAGDYVGFDADGCKFILQNYVDDYFASNLMLNVKVEDVHSFRNKLLETKIPERFGVKVSEVVQQPYGTEVNLIDAAGVCWHFVQ